MWFLEFNLLDKETLGDHNIFPEYTSNYGDCFVWNESRVTPLFTKIEERNFVYNT